MKVLILFDQAPADAPPDLADNTVQADEVAEILTSLGCRVERLAMTPDPDALRSGLFAVQPDLVFNLVEAPEGQGRLIADAPARLDELGLAYTGAGTEAMRTTSNKLLAKHRLLRAGLPTPGWIESGQVAHGRPEAEKYIIKSVWEHGSIGLEESSIVPGGDLKALAREMDRRRQALGGECFAEEFIDGREFNLSLLAGPAGPTVLPPAEIIFQGFSESMARIVGYQAKWAPTAYEFSHTPRSFDFGPQDRVLIDSLTDLALACWRLFNLRGWARVDFRVDPAGRPFILEINANPCLAADAGFRAAAARRGLGGPEVIGRIINDALARLAPDRITR